MIFGAMIIGVGFGLAALVVALVSGASALVALSCYCLAGLIGAGGSCVARALRGKLADMAAASAKPAL